MVVRMDKYRFVVKMTVRARKYKGGAIKIVVGNWKHAKNGWKINTWTAVCFCARSHACMVPVSLRDDNGTNYIYGL